MITLLKRRHLPPINPSLHLHLQTLSTNTIKHLPKPQELSNPNPFLSLLHSCSNLFSLKQIHALLVVHGLIQNLPLNTKLVSSYCAFESLESARKVFDEIPDPDLYSWKVMLRWYVVSDHYVEAIGFYGRRMRQCLLVEDNVVFSLVLKACVKSLDIDEGKKVHGHVVKVGNLDCFVLNCLVDMYAKCEDIEVRT
ncbi:Pentatricopeptide repeat-containing protein, mitochondrial [Ananas comosus]|uniref:Pentatricopeptide repeat-containing protein, mitochondrial n=1 Tax=Ananas comosus TaxID=4615 RepID=A0A199VY14_ANACO|nr:Pentatricopeptide repeat-containing protein, mitochondrial [Ananas comosus]